MLCVSHRPVSLFIYSTVMYGAHTMCQILSWVLGDSDEKIQNRPLPSESLLRK